MTTLAQNLAIQAPVVSPFLALIDPVSTGLQQPSKAETFPLLTNNSTGGSSIGLSKVYSPWGFYPATRPLSLFRKASQLPFQMKARAASNRALTHDFITLLNTVKIRRNILLTLDCAQPIGAFDRLILSVVQADQPDTTKEELRRELEYLAWRDLIKVARRHDGRWFCQLRGVVL